MRWSFITDGNYINFRHTDETDLHIQSVVHRLHNTSRCIDWSLPSDTTRITFTIDESKYENVKISDVDFDGVVLTTQAGFETGITAMFTGLAGGSTGGSSYLLADLSLNNTQFKALGNGSTNYDIVADLASGKMPLIVGVLVYWDFSNGGYTNVGTTSAELSISLTKGGAAIKSMVYILRADKMANLGQGQQKFGQPIITAQNIPSPLSLSTSLASSLTTSQLSGTGLQLTCYNDDLGAFTGGHASNVFKLKVFYLLVDSFT